MNKTKNSQNSHKDKRGRKNKTICFAEKDFKEKENSNQKNPIKYEEVDLKFSQVIESIANKSVIESLNFPNKEAAYESYLKENCDVDFPERTLMRLYGCEFENIKEYMESQKAFICNELLKNDCFEGKDLNIISEKISEILSLVNEKNHDFPYIAKNLKHIYEPEFSESNIWDISILCDLHRKFFIEKKNTQKKFLKLKSKKTFSAEINSEIEHTLLPLVKTQTEITFLKSYMLFLETCNDEMLEKNKGNDNNLNQNKIAGSELMNEAAKNTIKRAKEFIYVLDKLKRSCFLPFKSISKNFEIIQEKQAREKEKSTSGDFANKSENRIGTKKSYNMNNETPNEDQKSLIPAKSYITDSSKPFSSYLNQFLNELQKLAKEKKNMSELNDDLKRFLSLELLYYPPLKAQLFKAFFEIANVKFYPTNKGAYELHFFNQYFKLRKLSAVRATDFNDETFLAALEQEEIKGNICIKFSFDNEDFEAIKQNVIEALNHGSNDEELNDFRAKVALDLIDLAISKEYGELLVYYKAELKDQAQKFLVKSAAQKLNEILSLNCKRNLALLRKSCNNGNELQILNEHPLFEELSPKTLSLIYTKDLEQIEVVYLNQYGQVQYHTRFDGVKVSVEEADENIQFTLDDKTKGGIGLLLRINEPEVVVIGAEDAFAPFIKKEIDSLVKDMYKTKEIKHFSKAILLETSIQDASINSPKIQQLLEAYPSDISKKAICLGRFVQNPLHEISLLWHFNPKRNQCLNLPTHPVIHLADKDILQIFYEKELVKLTNQQGIEINKITQHPHLAGPLQFISSLGYFKAQRILETLYSLKNKALNCREELNSVEALKVFPSVIYDCKQFFTIKNSVNNSNIYLKNPLEALNVCSAASELIIEALKFSPLYEKKASLEQNIEKILLNKFKESQIKIGLLQMNHPDIFDVKNQKSPAGLKKHSLTDIIEYLNKSNVIRAESEFRSIQLSDLMRKQVNFNLIPAKLVTAKIIKIDFDEKELHCQLFNDFKAYLPFENVLKGITENFISEMHKKIKAGDFIVARILKINNEENSFELFFPTKNFVENFLKPETKSSNTKFNFNPFWRFFEDENYYSGKNLKFPVLTDGTYSYNDNRFYLENIILPLSSALDSERSLLVFLSKQSKYFLNVNYQTAKECLVNFNYENREIFQNSKTQPMPFLFIPSERMPRNKLFLCLKVFNDRFWKIPISFTLDSNSEMDLEAEKQRINYIFKINDEVFNSLDEIVDKYVIRITNVLKSFKNHSKFDYFLNKEHFKETIDKRNKQNLPRLFYNYTIFSEFPMHVLLGYFYKNVFILEFIRVTTTGFVYHEKEFNIPDQISTFLKNKLTENSPETIEETVALSQRLEIKLKQNDCELEQEEENEFSLLTQKNKSANIIGSSKQTEMLIDSCSSVSYLKQSDSKIKKPEQLQQEEADMFTFLGVKRKRSRSPQVLITREIIPEIIQEAEKDKKFLNNGYNISMSSNDIKEYTASLCKLENEEMQVESRENYMHHNTNSQQNKNKQKLNSSEMKNKDLNQEKVVDEIDRAYDVIEVNKRVHLDKSFLKIDDWVNPIKQEPENKVEFFSITDNNKVNSDNKENNDFVREWGKFDDVNELIQDINAFSSNSNERKVDEWGNPIENDNNNAYRNPNPENQSESNYKSNEHESWGNGNNSNTNYNKRNNFGSDSVDYNNHKPSRGRGDRGRGDRGRGRGRGAGDNTSDFRGRERDNNNNNFNKKSREFSRDENRNNGGRGDRERGRNNFNNNRDRNNDSGNNYNRRTSDTNQDNNCDWGTNNSNNNNEESSENNNNFIKSKYNHFNSEANNGWGANDSVTNVNKNDEWGNPISSKTELPHNIYNEANTENDSGWGAPINKANNSKAQNLNPGENENSDWGSDCNSNCHSNNNNHSDNNFNNFENSNSSNNNWNSNSGTSNFGGYSNNFSSYHNNNNSERPPRRGGARGSDNSSRPKGCYNCGEEGHFGRDCPQPKKERDSRPKGCYNCGEEGHFGRDCPQPKKENGDSRPKGCFNCGEEGHMSRDCPKPRKERRQSSFNNNKNENNNENDCNSSGRGGRDFSSRPKGCYNCGEEGHIGRDCPQPRKPRDNNGNNNFKKPSGCFNCGEEGHVSRDCPQPRKESRPRGRGNGNRGGGSNENNWKENNNNNNSNFNNSDFNNKDNNYIGNNDAVWNFTGNRNTSDSVNGGWRVEGKSNINTGEDFNNNANGNNHDNNLDSGWGEVATVNTDTNNQTGWN